VDRLLIGPSETYDVVIQIPDNKQYEFLATAEDRSGYSSLWLGSGKRVEADKLPKLRYFAGMKMMNDMMKMNGEMKPMDMKMGLQEMDMNRVMYPEMQSTETEHQHGEMDHHAANRQDSPQHQSESDSLYVCPMHPNITADSPGNCPKCGMDMIKKNAENQRDKKGVVSLHYNMLEATENTVLPEGSWRTLKFELNGNMNRYVWSINNKTVSESDKILIEKGENLRIILYNNTMMRHPMHL